MIPRFLTAALVAALTLLDVTSSHDLSAHGHAKRAHAELHARTSLSKCASRLRTRELDEYRLSRRNELIEEFLVSRRREKREWIPRAKPQPGNGGNGTNTCVLAPEAVVGPYYLHDQLIRKDIRKGEGERGIPLLLDLQFVDVNTCDPVRNAMVDKYFTVMRAWRMRKGC